MVEKILIIGQDSQIGSFLKKKLKNFNLYGTTRHKDRVSSKTLFFDLEEPTFQIDFSRFDAAIICASVTNLQKCNQKIEECERINVQNTIKLIDILSSHNCFSIFLSSNAVFDGKKPFYDIHSKANPESNYGKFKLAVELYIMENINSACVLRLTKVVNDKSHFIKQWEKDYKEGREIIAFTNHLLSPILEKDVVNAISFLIQQQSSGLYHLGSKDELSFYDYAKILFASNKKKLSKLKPTKDLKLEGNFVRHNSLKTNLKS